MSIQSRFTPQDLERVKAAVRNAEAKISGEIVPVFVEKSGHYSIAVYRAFLALAGLAFLAIIVFDRYIPSLAIYDPLMIFLMVILVGLIGSLAAHYIDPFKRLMMSQTHLDQATRKRAENAFLEEEVFATRHRTGIMIFVSFFEREVIVMADRGISKVVEQKEWDKMVRSITENIRLGKVTEGIEAAIIRSGEILLEKGFLKTVDDVNELRDDLRME
ncbi:MAG: TPM domain-containing protein [Cyclobacteriaceae bacterium]|jgi:putative membrane protein